MIINFMKLLETYEDSLSQLSKLSENEVIDYLDTLVEYMVKDPAREFIMQLLTQFNVAPSTPQESTTKYVNLLLKKFGKNVLEFPVDQQFWKNTILRHATDWPAPAASKLAALIVSALG